MADRGEMSYYGEVFDDIDELSISRVRVYPCINARKGTSWVRSGYQVGTNSVPN